MAKSTSAAHVFISSTVNDLREFRRAVIDAVWRLDMDPITMEQPEASMSSAVPVDPTTYSLQMLDTADIYICILAWRYGSIPPGQDRSITELEYQRARQRGIPICVFMADPDHPVPLRHLETDPERGRKLEQFKDELLKSHVVDFFASPDDLALKVLAALARLELEQHYSAITKTKIEAATKLSTSTAITFLSYRREDTMPTCLHLVYRLEQHFGPQAIYMDEGSIPPGADWREHIKEAIAKCGILLALIGSRWLDVTDSRGQRRLDDDADVLRQEIESALRRRIPVIPVLIDGVAMPNPQQLPESLIPLCDRQSLRLRNSRADFGDDVQHIIEATEHWISPLSFTA